MEGEPVDKEIVEEELGEEALKAVALCAEINAELEKAEENETATEEFLESILSRFKAALDLDPECLDAHIGIVYVCGLLGLYEEGLEEIRVIEELGLEDERLPEMKENLLKMKSEAEEEGEDGNEGEGGDEKSIDAMDLEPPTVEKLIVNGQVQPKFLAALTEIFERFDQDKDQALNPQELSAFHMVTNGAPMDANTLRFLRQHFECDRNKNLTLTGFLNFYISQSLGDVSETMKDLRNLGYDDDLNRISQ